MSIPNNFEILEQTELQKKLNNLKLQYIPPNNTIIPKAPEVLVCPNPVHETNRILENPNEKINELSNKLESANTELKSIHYENLKYNAQIEVLNKTIDSQTDELEQLRNINAELKTSNKILIENNKHYWRNTILISLTIGTIMFILGLFSIEVKELLLSVL